MSINGRELLRQSVLENWHLWKAEIDAFRKKTSYKGTSYLPAKESYFQTYFGAQFVSTVMPGSPPEHVQAVATLLLKKINESYCPHPKYAHQIPNKLEKLFSKIEQGPLKTEAEKEINRIRKKAEQLKKYEDPSIHAKLTVLKTLVDKIAKRQSTAEEEKEIALIVASIRELREAEALVLQKNLADLNLSLEKIKEASVPQIQTELLSLEKQRKKISQNFKEMVPSEIQARWKQDASWLERRVNDSKKPLIIGECNRLGFLESVIACCQEPKEMALENTTAIYRHLQGNTSVNASTISEFSTVIGLLEHNQRLDKRIQAIKQEFPLC